jgi:hypothetical protein
VPRGKADLQRARERFYAKALGDAQMLRALAVDGIDEEIAVLRLHLEELLTERPEDYALMLKNIELIVRAVAARFRMSPQNAEDLAQHASAALESFGRQLFPERFHDV